MSIIYPDGHPKATQAWYELDVDGMDQQTIDVFISEIKRYFSEVEIKDGKIIYRDSVTALTLEGANELIGYYNHLHIQFNLKSKHENVILVSKYLGQTYNEVWEMDPLIRSYFANHFKKLLFDRDLNALLSEGSAN